MSVETKIITKMNTEINTEQNEINTAIAAAVVDVEEQLEFALNKKPKKVVIKTGGEKKIVTKKEETKEPEPIQKLSATDDDDEELRESDRQLELAMERNKAIRMKKALGSQAMTILAKVRDNITTDINDTRKAVAKLREEIKEFESQLELINSINPETDDVVGFLQEYYKEYVDDVIDSQVSKEVAAKVAPKASSSGATRKREVINTEDRLNAIPDRLVLRASGKHKVDKERVVVLDIIYRAETQTFYRYGKGEKTEFKALQDANREWCFARGIPKDRLENGWEMFKAIDKQGTLKPLSIQHIHTADGNWTTDMVPETLARFVDKKFKF